VELGTRNAELGTVWVRLFARFRDAIGAESVAVPLPGPRTAAALRRQMGELYPDLAGLLERSAIAVNGEFANDDTPVTPDDEVALLPPVSGG
jgi:molybdopterin converting factor subunit 1